ncbi:MAG: PLP-dependent aminotransferase family protein [Pseudonocardia sp.]|nr:PLP-dependent aminotransferase family protein [Pseudonocardia sp.]
MDRERPLVDLPPLVLDRDDRSPLAVQLADALRAAARAGAVRVGDRLPSTRSLAAGLAVSRTVTAAAYDQLLAEGWVAGRHGAGTFVVAVPAAPRAGPEVAPPARHRAAAGPRDGTAPVDLRPGMPCVAALDRAAWRRAWRAGADEPPDVVPDAVGLPAFRSAVVEHLLRHRGLAADPGGVLATGGTTAAVAELARTLPRGARVAVEEPGYQRAAAALRGAGLAVLPVPVDGDGLVVDALPAGLAAVYCTPAHQFPLGARLSAARRVALVARARAEGFLVVEDDYDGELRYDVAPLPLLAALGPDVVVHLGTASKLLTPTLGAGWLVAPPAVRDAVVAQRDRAGVRPARAGQRVFAALAVHGDLGRHLRRLRRELAQRRRAVVAAVAAAAMPVCGDAAGAHVVVRLADPAAEEAAVAAAADRGVALDGLARHHTGAPTVAGLVLGYAGPARPELDRALPVVTTVLRRAASSTWAAGPR